MSENPKPCHSIGVQWGLWIWSDSQYKWVGGTGGGIVPPPPPPPPQAEISDDFNDNSLDSNKWITRYFMKRSGVDVFERSQRLEVALKSDDTGPSPKAGVRLKDSRALKGKTVLVDVYVPYDGQDYVRVYLMITPEAIPEDIEKGPHTWIDENSKKAYQIGAQPKAVWATKFLNGDITGLGQKNFTEETWTGKFRIVWTGTTITFQVYRGGGWHDVGSDTCMFGDTEALHIYLWAEDNWARSVVHQLTDLWYDNFSVA